MSNELGIDEQRNWNKAHATFGIDNVIDKMFPDRETLIDSSNQKILSVFFPPEKARFGILAWAKSQNLYVLLIAKTASVYTMRTCCF